MNFKEKLEEVLLQFNPKELHIKGPKKYRFSDTTKNDFFEFVAPTYINLYSHQIQFSDILQYEQIQGYIDKIGKDKCIEALHNMQTLLPIDSGIEETTIDNLKQSLKSNLEVLLREYTILELFEKVFEGPLQKIVMEPLMNKLRRCTLFVIPNYRNDIAALRVGLIPFMYKNEFYLAAENDVDPDPRYEAYYAITHGALFADSIYAPDMKENWNYFRTIVGEEVAKEVEQVISLSEKEYVIHIVV